MLDAIEITKSIELIYKRNRNVIVAILRCRHLIALPAINNTHM